MRKAPPPSAVPHVFLHRELVRHPSAILLVTQLLGVLLYSLDDAQSPVWRVVFEVFGAGVLALAIWSVRDQPGPTWLAVVLGVAASSLSITAALSGSEALTLWAAVVHALFYFVAAGSMLAYMLSDSDVTSDELWAVGATFTLLAWAFAYVFTALQLVVPGSFTAAVDPDAPRTWMELLFLSFTNLSSTGLSDVVPILPKARAVVMIEQLCGLAYVALFVSRVVGLTLSRRRMTQPEAGERPDLGPHASGEPEAAGTDLRPGRSR
ncbi:MAG: ion channel [Janthinobacterium lividum]